MGDGFQRIFERSEPAVMSLGVQAALGPVVQPERSQISHLFRLFLERFFNHETASPDTDAKTRMVQIACAAGLPGLVVAMYLWPVYHPVIIYPPRHDGIAPGPPPYWVQVNHHFFFVMYSFVAMGLATVFEWDQLFPDLLDVSVLGTLPIAPIRTFLARVGAIAVFVAGFLFDANILAPLVLPLATDPPNLLSFLAGHVLSVAAAGLFAALLVLLTQSALLAIFGERWFRRFSLAIQGVLVTAFLLLLLLFPVLSGVVPALLGSAQGYARWFPPFWFLSMDQRVLEGAVGNAVYARLAGTGFAALAIVAVFTVLTYPIAYVRRVRALVEGSASRSKLGRVVLPWNGLLHATLVRPPAMRAIFHFISHTLQRVPRYQIYLVMYGGVGVSVVIATILRLDVVRGRIEWSISADGIRTAVGIIAFWVIAGLRTAFVSSGNRQGSWILWAIHGRPPHFEAAIAELNAARVWVMLCAGCVTLSAVAMFRLMAPPELLTLHATAAQVVAGAGMCVLLTDFFFLQVTTVACTGEAGTESNLAFTVLRYFTFFPLVSWLSWVSQPWMQSSGLHLGIATGGIVVLHLWLRWHHRAVVRQAAQQIPLEDGEDEFPMRLGLRY
ncbi:MAG TPA: hypothetical protein VMD29_15550 [Terracidiphilus sp.]|nr:hypothetical protein [Terracidiphilus sp.]